jgi:outer membrane lipoprotein-sorting protein
MTVFFRYRWAFVLICVLPLTGCLFRSRKVERPVSNAALKVATQADLIRWINEQAGRIQSLQATVDIDTSVGGVNKGKVTDYQQIRGYVLLRKPAMLRMIGLVPIIRNRAFDMVSDGNIFKVWIPSKNRFVIGRNDVPSQKTNSTLEKLRPQQIYDALVLRAIDPNDEIAVMENDSETVTDPKGHKVDQPDYELNVIRKGGQGWFLSRKIIFSRIDLLPHRQLIFDENGNLATNCRYDAYKGQNGIMFPWQIEIVRPQEEYDITLTLIKLQINEPLPDDKFALEQPPGAEVVHLDQTQSGSQPSAHLHGR